VLSRRFQQQFTGDEFKVYRALRNVNPSPYLFFFDYGDYKLLGSSPESQLIINKGKAIVHPIAGTFKRSGDDEIDRAETERLKQDAKENAEHVMLVDLARNDLSRLCTNVSVAHYKQVQYYSHVIHLVSEVVGDVPSGTNPFLLLAKTFPAGTLSGAPKIKAMELINTMRQWESQRAKLWASALVDAVFEYEMARRGYSVKLSFIDSMREFQAWKKTDTGRNWNQWADGMMNLQD
jgi:anthranilate synthase component 1